MKKNKANIELIKANYLLDIEKSRRINRLLTGIKILKRKGSRHKGLKLIAGSYKKIHMLDPDAFMRSASSAQSPLLLPIAAIDKTPYPNARFISVDETPSYAGGIKPIIVGSDWKTTLRPSLESSDAILIDGSQKLSATKRKTAEELVAEANKLKIPTISVADRDYQLTEAYCESSKYIVCKTDEVYENAKNNLKSKKILRYNQPIDITLYNPFGWQYKPKTKFALIGLNQPSDEDAAAIKASGIKLKMIYAHEEIEHIEASGFDLIEDINADVIHACKEFRSIVCLPSMFPDREEFELTLKKLLASGVFVLTTDEAAVKSIDVPSLQLLKKEDNMPDINDPEKREKASIVGRRKILDASSTFSEVKDLVSKTNIKTDYSRKISIIMCTNRPDYIEYAIENAKKQSYPDKELILVLHGNGFDKKSMKKSLKSSGLEHKIVEASADMVFGEALNKGLDASTGYYVTKFDDDDGYGKHHLKDLELAIRYSQADVVGKWAHFVYLGSPKEMLSFEINRQEKFSGHLPGATFLIRRSLLSEYRFSRVKRAIDSTLWDRLKANGRQLYSTNRYNFVRVRHGGNTWDVADNFFRQRSSKTIKTDSIEKGFI